MALSSDLASNEAFDIGPAYYTDGGEGKKDFIFSGWGSGDDARPRIVVFAGSERQTFLESLKRYPVELTVIVSPGIATPNSSAPGQNSGLDLLDTIFRCMLALRGDNPELEVLGRGLGYRIGGDSSLTGLSMGSFVLSRLAEAISSVECALEEMGHLLEVSGKVIPITQVCVEQVCRRAAIGANPVRATCGPPVRPRRKASPEAVQAMIEADAIVLGPADLHSCLLPALSVEGVSDALASSHAVRIFVCEALAARIESRGVRASELLKQIIARIGPGNLDWVVVNNALLDSTAVGAHGAMGEEPVIADLDEVGKLVPGIISAPLVEAGTPIRINAEHTVRAILQALLVGRIRQRPCGSPAPTLSAKVV